MNYFLIKLEFDSCVHFGTADSAQSLSASEDHVLADTLFSALCHTALQLHGQDGIDKLCSWVKDGQLLLSDTMPWNGENYFLPKPCVLSESRRELPAGQAKAMKKMAWIPVTGMHAFSQSIHGDGIYDPQQHQVSFGFHTEVTRAATPYGKDARPYQVGLYRFREDCGLYFLAGTETPKQEEMLISLLSSLGLSGLGGKISSGCGRFHIEDTILLNEYFDEQTQWLYEALSMRSGKGMLLTSSLPREEEMERTLEDAAYQTVRRAGFISSDRYGETPQKKKTQYFLRAGSVLQNRFEGDLYSVGGQGNHPVYRYGKPLFLGVTL